jgi:Subtilase family
MALGYRFPFFSRLVKADSIRLNVIAMTVLLASCVATASLGRAALADDLSVVEAYMKVAIPNISCETVGSWKLHVDEVVPQCFVIHRNTGVIRLRWAGVNRHRVKALFGFSKFHEKLEWFEIMDGSFKTQSIVESLFQDSSRNFYRSIKPNILEPNDPSFVSEAILRLRSILGIYRVNAGAVVAIIDSGVNFSSASLRAMRWSNVSEIPDNGIDDDKNGFVDDVYGWDFVDNDVASLAGGDEILQDNDPTDSLGHGTAVATILEKTLGAQLGSMVQIMALRVASGSAGVGTASPAAVAEAIYYAVDNGAQIVNLSVGSSGSYALIQSAIEYGISKGVLFVAAAGNSGGEVYFPAKIPGVLSVGALTDRGILWDQSARGDKVDLLVLGTNALDGLKLDRAFNLSPSGTSYSAPVVTAASAMLFTLFSGADTYCSLTRMELTGFKPLNKSLEEWLSFHLNRFEENISSGSNLRLNWIANSSICGANVTVNALLRRPD